jgi:hypothetical protein
MVDKRMSMERVGQQQRMHQILVQAPFKKAVIQKSPNKSQAKRQHNQSNLLKSQKNVHLSAKEPCPY